MNDQGFYPPHDCRVCGKPLCGQGGDRPAELYGGTYTGLCYGCERGHAFKVSTAFDGAETWSHPPHCPAWRRTRETFIGFPECPACKGQGMKWVSRSNSQGGSYSVQCETCGPRYWNHPIRKWWQRRSEQFTRAVRNRFNFLAPAMTKEWVDLYLPLYRHRMARGLDKLNRIAKERNIH